MRITKTAALLLFALGTTAAHAADAISASTPAPTTGFGKNAARWEARLGGGGYDVGPFTPDTFTGGTVNGEILAPSFDFLSFLGAPRPYIGTDIAISKDPINAFYAGFNWEYYLTERVSLGFSAGGAIMSDTEKRNEQGETRDLGSRVLFHLQASAGYDFTPNLGAQIYLNHFSNANLADSNDGLESTGARLVWRF
ncbi:MAG: acyloxyacyl hydrolase [Methylobacterium mesophilicum]|nr:acyloxyacyl hydrolase [Methylobacterium mesophilicum]